jgi:hypothetical protein
MLKFIVELVLQMAILAFVILIGIFIVWAVTGGRAKFNEKRGDLYKIVGLLFFLLLGVIVYLAFPTLRPK